MVKKQTDVSVPASGSLTVGSQTARGFENFRQEDLIVPRLRLLQGLSKAVTDGKGKMGDFQDSLTEENLGLEIEVVLMGLKNGAVYFMPEGMKCKSEDGMRSKNGDTCLACPYGEYWGKFHEDGTPPGCAGTKEFVAVTRKTLQGIENRPMIITFLKTSYGLGKRLASMARLTGKDIFAKSYVLKSERMQNKKGSFATFTVAPGADLPADELKASEGWYNMLSTVKVQATEEVIETKDVQPDDIGF